ncbi:MAG: spore coat associated protein CotJA [Lachnospiraceae bacterium]|nr:spore coat associated protein CotJA [Lachnospiraceae bacterium]MBQ5868627.1 spore coat associated protein CotJA [Lachnospiraceae bacterium]
MNHNSNNGCPVCSPGIVPPSKPVFDLDRFPVGMGYVPWQNWETTYPLTQGYHRGTIFPSLDYPFVIGRCRR